MITLLGKCIVAVTYGRKSSTGAPAQNRYSQTDTAFQQDPACTSVREHLITQQDV